MDPITGLALLLVAGFVGYEVFKPSPKETSNTNLTLRWSVKRNVKTSPVSPSFHAGDFVTVTLVDSQTKKEIPMILIVSGSTGSDSSGSKGMDCVYDLQALAKTLPPALLPPALDGLAMGTHFAVFPLDVLIYVPGNIDVIKSPTGGSTGPDLSLPGSYSIVHAIGPETSGAPGDMAIVILKGNDGKNYVTPLAIVSASPDVASKGAVTADAVFEKTLAGLALTKFKTQVHKVTGSDTLPVPPGSVIGAPSDLPDGTHFALVFSAGVFSLGDVIKTITAAQMASDIGGERFPVEAGLKNTMADQIPVNEFGFGAKPYGGAIDRRDSGYGGRYAAGSKIQVG